jgi:signal transduction histidine kinase
MARNPADVARALGLVYLGGPSIAVVSLLLPHTTRTSELGIWILCAIAYAVVPVLFGLYSRLPPWTIEVLIAFAAALVTMVVWFDGQIASEYAFFYLWPTPFAFVYFTLPRALAQLAFSATAYAVVLALIAARYPAPDNDVAISYWLLEVSALITVGLLVRALARAIQKNADEREHERRREALEINDTVLQRLVVAQTAHRRGEASTVTQALADALDDTRAIVSGLLHDDVAPGDLRRTTGATTRTHDQA